MHFEEWTLQFQKKVKEQFRKSGNALDFTGEILNKCEYMLEEIETSLTEVNYPNERLLKQMQTIFYVFTNIVRFGQATNLLCLLGYSDCASILLRSMLETYFDLKLMTKEDDKEKRILSYHLLGMRSRMYFAKKAEKGELPVDWLRNKLITDKKKNESDFQASLKWAEIDESKLKELWGKRIPRSFQEIAQMCDEEVKFYLHYSLLSAQGHSGPDRFHKYVFDITGRSGWQIERDEIDDIAFMFLDIIVPAINIIYDYWPNLRNTEREITQLCRDYLSYFGNKPGAAPTSEL